MAFTNTLLTATPGFGGATTVGTSLATVLVAGTATTTFAVNTGHPLASGGAGPQALSATKTLTRGYVRVKFYSPAAGATLTSVKIAFDDGTANSWIVAFFSPAATMPLTGTIGQVLAGTDLIFPFITEINAVNCNVVTVTATANVTMDVEVVGNPGTP
jgi:hypothetical protein